MTKAYLAALALLASMFGLTEARAASAETIKLAHSTWVGFGPLYVVRDKGIFKKNGVDVDLSVIEEAKPRFAALNAGRIQMVASSVDAALLYLKTPREFQYLVALDDSRGGDGIVADKAIATIADLKGRSVAVGEGSVSDFYLNVLLAKAGLKETDLKLVDLGAEQAADAFIAKRVDAAVTWEPWLSRGTSAPNGHLLTDSASTPGLIVDALLAKSSWIAAHPKAAGAIVRSWNEAVADYRAHPDEDIAIMAKGVGGWLKDPKEFKETLSGAAFYGAAENRAFFGTAARPGPFANTVQYAIDVWSRHGKLRLKTSPARLIDYRFIAAARS